MAREPPCSKCGKSNPELEPNGKTKCCSVRNIPFIWRCSKCYSESIADAGLHLTVCCQAPPLRCKLCRTARSTRWGRGPAGKNTLCAPCTTDFDLKKGPFGSTAQLSRMVPDKSAFLSVMVEYQKCRIDAGSAVQQVAKLCGSKSDLLNRFNGFLPDRWRIVVRDGKVLVQCPASVDVFPDSEKTITPTRRRGAPTATTPKKAMNQKRRRNSISTRATPSSTQNSKRRASEGQGDAKLPPLLPRSPELILPFAKHPRVGRSQSATVCKVNVSLKENGPGNDGYATDVSWHRSTVGARAPPPPNVADDCRSGADPKNKTTKNGGSRAAKRPSTTPRTQGSTPVRSERLKNNASTKVPLKQPVDNTIQSNPAKRRTSPRFKRKSCEVLQGSSAVKRKKIETARRPPENPVAETEKPKPPTRTLRSNSGAQLSPPAHKVSVDKNRAAIAVTPKKPTRTSPRKRAPTEEPKSKAIGVTPETNKLSIRKRTANATRASSDVIDLTNDDASMSARRKGCSSRLRVSRSKSRGRLNALSRRRNVEAENTTPNTKVKKSAPSRKASKTPQHDVTDANAIVKKPPPTKQVSKTPEDEIAEVAPAEAKPSSQLVTSSEKSKSARGRRQPKTDETRLRKKSPVDPTTANDSSETPKKNDVDEKKVQATSASPQTQLTSPKPPEGARSVLTPLVMPCVDCGTPAEQGPWRANSKLCFECIELRTAAQREEPRKEQLRLTEPDTHCDDCGLGSPELTKDGVTSCCGEEAVRVEKQAKSVECEKNAVEPEQSPAPLSPKVCIRCRVRTTNGTSGLCNGCGKYAEQCEKPARVVEEKKEQKQKGDSFVSDPKSPVPSDYDREALLEQPSPAPLKKQTLVFQPSSQNERKVIDKSSVSAEKSRKHNVIRQTPFSQPEQKEQKIENKEKPNLMAFELPADLAAFVSVDFVLK